MPKKELELRHDVTATLNEQLMDDADFISDLAEAGRAQDIPELTSMYMALVGGEETYKKIRQSIEAEKGYFSQTEFNKVIDKISEQFPKDGNRAQRRSWKTSRS